MFAEILVEYSVKSLDKTFTYVIPDKFKDKLQVGMKVVVPFGKKFLNGFVLDILNVYEDAHELKTIVDIDLKLKLNEELMEMGKVLKEKTLCSLISAYQTMLPSSLKVKDQKHNYQLFDTYVVLNEEAALIEEYIRSNGRAKKQIEFLELLLLEHIVLKKNYSQAVIKILLKKGLIREEKQEKYRLKYEYTLQKKKVLTDDQKRAVEQISDSFNKSETILLHGVTGSGKTEVYMELIEQVISQNKKALMLVPEISLTAQIVKRFYERFGNLVAVFHSALSDGEKYDEYLKIARGEISVVVGTRSSIFTPTPDLGIIIIDEEHSENYKQDNNPRYLTLDMAQWRSKYNQIPIVLASATPCLESMARAKKGLYKLVELPNRIGKAVMPEVTLVDMVEEMKKRNPIFSEELTIRIKEGLEKKEQTILLLNRRGFSTTITCSNCGFTYKCPHCDITLTYHKSSNNLRCHYCGYTKFKDEKCPECLADALNYFGLGTEKLELEIKKKFPTARVVRMDADTTKNKGSHEKIISDFQQEKYDILVGTQMISKGLDFPKVSLVGVISADASLNIPDFRSSEHTFELLAQVAGRAGRSDILGKVIIQTFNPDNRTLNFVRDNNYSAFYDYEMGIRKKLGYSPYYFLTSIKITSRDYTAASTEASKVGAYLKKQLSDESKVLGPTTANMFKLNNIYRFQIIIKYKKDPKLVDSLQELDRLYAMNRNVNLEIDMSPLRI